MIQILSVMLVRWGSVSRRFERTYILKAVGIPQLLKFFFKSATLDAGLLARNQYSESPATGHLDTGFSWYPCV